MNVANPCLELTIEAMFLRLYKLTGMTVKKSRLIYHGKPIWNTWIFTLLCFRLIFWKIPCFFGSKLGWSWFFSLFILTPSLILFLSNNFITLCKKITSKERPVSRKKYRPCSNVMHSRSGEVPKAYDLGFLICRKN